MMSAFKVNGSAFDDPRVDRNDLKSHFAVWEVAGLVVVVQVVQVRRRHRLGVVDVEEGLVVELRRLNTKLDKVFANRRNRCVVIGHPVQVGPVPTNS